MTTECVSCGQFARCRCHTRVWGKRVRTAMDTAVAAAAHYRGSFDSGELATERSDRLRAWESAQGRVLDLQWVESGETGFTPAT